MPITFEHNNVGTSKSTKRDQYEDKESIRQVFKDARAQGKGLFAYFSSTQRNKKADIVYIHTFQIKNAYIYTIICLVHKIKDASGVVVQW